MSAFYAIYHGPEGLKQKANYVHSLTIFLAEGLKKSGNKILTNQYFDTIKVKPKLGIEELRKRAESKKINLRYFLDNQHVLIFIIYY
jgi:glycine dehydrogenase